MLASWGLACERERQSGGRLRQGSHSAAALKLEHRSPGLLWIQGTDFRQTFKVVTLRWSGTVVIIITTVAN